MNDLQDQTRWMHNLIEGILQYSRLGRVKSVMEEIDSASLIVRQVEVLAPPAHINVVVENDLPRIVYDRTHLEQVFQNLIGNAIKHMGKPSGTITISCLEQEGLWRFLVCDTGIGIAKKHHERIFKIFQTLKPRDEADGSTGIGLSLVKKIVGHHGGSILVESQLDQGTTFSFSVSKKLKPKSLDQGFTVLTIDDNKDFGDVATAMLKRAGYEPLHVSSGVDALKLLANRRHPVHVILLDINLPGEQVVDLYVRLRCGHPAAKIVVCTGDFMCREVEMLRKMGIDGVLNKPFDLNELSEVLQHCATETEGTPHG